MHKPPEWKLSTIVLSKLKMHPRNPRQLSKHDAEHLQESLNKFGLIDKPIINLDYQVIAGHQRIKLLKRSKVKDVQCWVPDRLLTQREVDELNIRHNRATGEWDFDILANEWELEDLVEWGFTAEELVGDLDDEGDEDQKPQKSEKQLECPSCGHTWSKNA